MKIAIYIIVFLVSIFLIINTFGCLIYVLFPVLKNISKKKLKTDAYKAPLYRIIISGGIIFEFFHFNYPYKESILNIIFFSLFICLFIGFKSSLIDNFLGDLIYKYATESLIADFFIKIELFIEQGQYDQALDISNRILKYNSTNHGILNLRGLCLMNIKEYDLALIDFNNAIKICPKNIFAHYARGNIKRLMQDYRDAIVDYQIAYDLSFDDEEKLEYLTNIKEIQKILNMQENKKGNYE